MINSLEEAIKHHEKVEEEKRKEACELYDVKNYEESKECIWCAEEHKQLAAWLKELEERREIQDILLQFLVDIDLDICCDELMNDETEQSICEATCNNHTKECWYRWAKMKAREVNADEKL